MNNKREFNQLVSKYLLELMETTKKKYGINSSEYRALYYQYIKTDAESQRMKECNQKHYEAIVDTGKEGLRYIERLYKRQATVDLTTACSAHCRYCLRQNYEDIYMKQKDEDEIIRYLSKDQYLKEVLITGGDPLLIIDRLIHFLGRVINEATNIRIIRIGTRVPVQNPHRLDDRILKFFYENREKVFFEIALQINHKIELQSETRNCIRELQNAGVTIYSQNVLLKNVNATINDLVCLYDELRYEHIESHYLFHPIPMSHTAHFRMPLKEFLIIAKELTSSGLIPGRSKPMFSVMTDIGKCTIYEGMLSEKDEQGYYIINTGYRLNERQMWNSKYVLPDSAFVGTDGLLRVKYLDGNS